ncbi:pseudaminic acid synthase [Candidatus Pelagibacter sp.]|nr:pseudaminic acid synthase [Candidatus Pelagibacter sp.]
MNKISISNFRIHKNSRPFIIAEISSNHKWSLKHTLKLIKKIKEAGADAVKIQTYDEKNMTFNSKKGEFIVKEGLWKNYSLHELYKSAKTPLNWHKKIFNYARKLNLIAFSTPFDEKSADFLTKLKVPAYKIASFEIIDHPLIEHIAKKQKTIILSTGMATIEEINDAVKIIKKFKNNRIVLLHCISNYPSKNKDYNLKMMTKLKERFNLHIGLSDHSKGNEVALAATALGAKVIEKHVKLDGDNSSQDSKFSMDTKKFKKFCENINNIWETLGSDNFNLRNDKLSRKLRRSIYVVKDIKKNGLINKDNIKKIRPANGLHPKYFFKILGKKVKKDIVAGTPMKINYVK